MRIGVFDSGIGGLTVLREVIQAYPNNEYIYYGDSANIPYGIKSKDELRILTDKIIKFLISKKVDLIIIACGTISSNLYSEIKDKYNIPIVDILMPTINYALKNNLKNIGVMATPMTIKSGFFQDNLENIKVVSCPKFVPLIEKGITKGGEIEEIVKEYLFSLKDCDNIILGCTHYPVLTPILQKYSASSFINMGKCLLDTLNVNDNGVLDIEIYFSKVNENIINNTNNIIKNDKKIIEWRL